MAPQKAAKGTLGGTDLKHTQGGRVKKLGQINFLAQKVSILGVPTRGQDLLQKKVRKETWVEEGTIEERDVLRATQTDLTAMIRSPYHIWSQLNATAIQDGLCRRLQSLSSRKWGAKSVYVHPNTIAFATKRSRPTIPHRISPDINRMATFSDFTKASPKRHSSAGDGSQQYSTRICLVGHIDTPFNSKWPDISPVPETRRKLVPISGPPKAGPVYQDLSPESESEPELDSESGLVGGGSKPKRERGKVTLHSWAVAVVQRQGQGKDVVFYDCARQLKKKDGEKGARDVLSSYQLRLLQHMKKKERWSIKTVWKAGLLDDMKTPVTQPLPKGHRGGTEADRCLPHTVHWVLRVLQHPDAVFQPGQERWGPLVKLTRLGSE